jgi:hypothetical protein
MELHRNVLLQISAACRAFFAYLAAIIRKFYTLLIKKDLFFILFYGRMHVLVLDYMGERNET